MAITIVFRPKGDDINIYDNPMDAVTKAHEIARSKGEKTFAIERGVMYTHSAEYKWTSMGTFDVPPVMTTNSDGFAR